VLGAEVVVEPAVEGLLLLGEIPESLLDTTYESLVGLDSYQSQKATAWTGAAVLTGLSIWGVLRLKRLYHQAVAAAPAWWEAAKAQMWDEWKAMTWKTRASYVGSVLAVFGVLSLFI
jgi:hypothetical protein